MPDNDIFTAATQTSVNTDSTTSQSGQQTNTDPFADLVGDGKRYKSPQELAKGKQEADAFIEQLKQEAAELRSELEKRLAAEEILAQIKATANTSSDPTTNQIDIEKLQELVQGTVHQLDTAKQAQSNLESVTKQIVEQYGDKAGEFLAKKSAELGLSVDDLKATAERSPVAFRNLVGLNKEPTQSTNMTHGTVNTEALSDNSVGTKVGTWEYYENLRKTNPRLYFSPKIQNEIFDNRKKLGDNFYAKR